MKNLSKVLCLFTAFLFQAIAGFSQSGEMDKFYSYYKPASNLQSKCDSLYKLIEQRRSEFSAALKQHKAENGSDKGFVYNWESLEKPILLSLYQEKNKTLKHLIYYSYFDLGYGTYGHKLSEVVCKMALKEIPPSSAVWAMEPSLVEKVIKYAGGEDKCKTFIQRLEKLNTDKNLLYFISCYLSPHRILKKGNMLPELFYRDIKDTTTTLSTKNFRGKYLLIDIWATWCKPCIEEIPLLKKEYLARDKQLEFLSISIDDKYSLVQTFMSKSDSPLWPQGIALSRKSILSTLSITGIPCPILVSPDGKVLNYGDALRGKMLEDALKEIKE